MQLKTVKEKGLGIVKNHIPELKVMLSGLAVTAMTGVVSADTTFGINGTVIDDMFAILNTHILPDVGGTISALPAIIIPIVILIVLIVVLMFVPELLYALLDMLRETFKFRR
jgi:hypothetical protein